MTMKKTEKKHGDAPRIYQIAFNIATQRGVEPYSETTVRQQLNGTRTLKPIVKEAMDMYYSLLTSKSYENTQTH